MVSSRRPPRSVLGPRCARPIAALVALAIAAPVVLWGRTLTGDAASPSGARVESSGNTEVTFPLRGKPQVLCLYGPPAGPPVVVSSGDGGWMHLGPQVAETLAARGFFVVGFDSRAYLSSFTTRRGALSEADVAADYRALAELAARATGRTAILAGVSEGAGLSVLAAAGRSAAERFQGVVAIGLAERNELGWRWLDAAVYLTHGVPHERLFVASSAIARVAPLPLAVINSTNDEFVPFSVQRVLFERARDPKRAWTVPARNHGFSDNLGAFEAALAEAVDWVAHLSSP